LRKTSPPTPPSTPPAARWFVDKLVGRRVRVRSLGGDVFVEAAYAAVLDVDTAGGALLMGEARVGKKATLKTRGGVVKLRGFAGDADAFCVVDTAGGACALELRAEAAGSLRVLTRGGDVALGVPEGFAADLRVSGRVDGEEVSLRRREEGENAKRGVRVWFSFFQKNRVVLRGRVRQPVRRESLGRRPRVRFDHAYGGGHAGYRRA
jgi:DUF4097 and DUF4098 domain-containing protein YvlB